MRKLTVLCTALALALVASSVSAKDMRGRFGVGYEAGLGGANGIALSYWFTDALGIDLDFGLGYEKGDGRLAFQTALGIRYNIARAKDVNLGVGLRVNFGFWNEDATGSFEAADYSTYAVSGRVVQQGSGTADVVTTSGQPSDPAPLDGTGQAAQQYTVSGVVGEIQGGTAVRGAAAGKSSTAFQAVIDIPITVEYFFSEYFAITLSTGLSFVITPDRGTPLSPLGALLKSSGTDEFSVFFGHGGVFGNAGFRFYF